VVKVKIFAGICGFSTLVIAENKGGYVNNKDPIVLTKNIVFRSRCRLGGSKMVRYGLNRLN
jgi:hypothetical protein